MIIELILLLITLILLIFHFDFIGLLSLILVIILFLYRFINNSMKKKNNTKKYLISFNALSNIYLKKIIESKLINGEIIISTKMIKKILEDKNKIYNKEIVLENLEYIKRNSIYKEIDIDFNIVLLFKYAYEHNFILIISGEKVQHNISKIFNIITIDLSILNIVSKNEIIKGKKIRYTVIENNGKCEGVLLRDIKVYIKNCDEYEKGKIYEGYADNILELNSKKIISIRGKNEKN